MAIFDIVQAVKDGRARYSWVPVTVAEGDLSLTFAIMADALRFDGMPPMRWNRQIYEGSSQTFDGVRLCASAEELQKIADWLGAMPMTPKVLDLVTLQAGEDGLLFDAVVNIHGRIVAISDIHTVHEAVEKAIANAGGYPESGGVVASVGKYWVLCKRLVGGKFGMRQAINYGWYSKAAPSRSVTGKLKLWQSMGGAHDCHHLDPSQVVRLMGRIGTLQRRGEAAQQVDLQTVLQDAELAPLISHEGVLPYVRFPCVPEPEEERPLDGVVLMPEMVITAGSMEGLS